jgi:hypothetical protein
MSLALVSTHPPVFFIGRAALAIIHLRPFVFTGG